MRMFLLAIALLLSNMASAQIVDDSSINDLQQGDVQFEEGAFVAYLADTVSPDYIYRLFGELKLQLRSVQIQPLSVILMSRPSDSVMVELQDHPMVRNVIPIRPGDIRMMLVDSLTTAGVSKEDIADVIADRMKESPIGSYLIQFDYAVTAGLAAEILGHYENMVFKFNPTSPRTITVLTEAGKEQETMDKVESLPFVQFTAMIGILGDQ